MSNSNLSPIRQRLVNLQQTAEAPTDIAAPLWDHPRSPTPASPHPPASPVPNPAPRTAMAQALRQRSSEPPGELTPEEMAAMAVVPPASLAPHLQRLQEEANQINHLARQQELAIQRFQRSAKGLAFVLLKQPGGSRWPVEQFCQLHPVTIAQVLQDDSGTLILTATDIDLYEDERQASQTAEEVRALRRGPVTTRPSLLATLVAEPISFLRKLWQTQWGGAGPAPAQFIPLDIPVWVIGGWIGRKALELAISAIPALWPWLVGATIGAVALALYRLLFAPQSDMAFVSRLLAALVGLAIGGQF